MERLRQWSGAATQNHSQGDDVPCFTKDRSWVLGCVLPSNPLPHTLLGGHPTKAKRATPLLCRSSVTPPKALFHRVWAAAVVVCSEWVLQGAVF